MPAQTHLIGVFGEELGIPIVAPPSSFWDLVCEDIVLWSAADYNARVNVENQRNLSNWVQVTKPIVALHASRLSQTYEK